MNLAARYKFIAQPYNIAIGFEHVRFCINKGH